MFPIERQILAAARPIARSLLDISLPSHAVSRDIERLSQNLIAMNEILRDREHCTVRLVMNPDKMVIGEAMRTFTYLNLYGYLTDAVIVNRAVPGRRRRVLRRAGAASRRSTWSSSIRRSRPCRSCARRTSSRRSSAAEMLDRLADALFGDRDPAAVLHDALTQELEVLEDGARLRLALPFADKGDISLKKIGLELIVGVDGQRRTIMLPPAMAAFARRRPRSRTARSR